MDAICFILLFIPRCLNILIKDICRAKGDKILKFCLCKSAMHQLLIQKLKFPWKFFKLTMSNRRDADYNLLLSL